MEIKLSTYTEKTSGRYKDSGEYSGEWFLEDILMPAINSLSDGEKIYLNFDNCQIHPGFLDEAFSKLISKYRFQKFADTFMFNGQEQSYMFDILGIIVGAEMYTFGKVITQII